MAVAEQTPESREAAKLLLNVRSLVDMTAEIAAAHDFSTTARLLLLTLLGSLSATRGVIWLYDRETGLLSASVTRGLTIEDETFNLSEQQVRTLQEIGGTLPLTEATEQFPFLAEIHHRWPELLVTVPLVVREELIGLLTIGGKLNRQPYTDSELELLYTLGTLAASGIYSHNLITGLQQTNKRLVDTQEQLIRSEQLATLGATAAGIAHEIGNPLTSIMGYAITIREMSEEMTPDLLQEFIEPILNESERLKQILEELKDYAKPKGYEMEPVPVSDCIGESTKFTRYDKLFRGKIQVQCIYDSDPVVLINRSKIKQVLLNLLKNAAQAMTMAETGRPPSLSIHVRDEEDSAFMCVIDNGPGIPPDKVDSIWQPFFTTKGAEGTGLGLDLCKQIIERHHGEIWCESTMGVGATFTIRLPVHRPGEEAEPAAADLAATG